MFTFGELNPGDLLLSKWVTILVISIEKSSWVHAPNEICLKILQIDHDDCKVEIFYCDPGDEIAHELILISDENHI